MSDGYNIGMWCKAMMQDLTVRNLYVSFCLRVEEKIVRIEKRSSRSPFLVVVVSIFCLDACFIRQACLGERVVNILFEVIIRPEPIRFKMELA